MSKVTLTDLANFQSDTTGVTQINANNAAITVALDNTLSRDGTSPNQMGANLDLNGFSLLNAANIPGLSDTIFVTNNQVGINHIPGASDNVLSVKDTHNFPDAGSEAGIFGYDTGAGGANANLALFVSNVNDDHYGDGLYMYYSRIDDPAQDGDTVGLITWIAATGSSGQVGINNEIAKIFAYIDTPAAHTSSPGSIDIRTTPAGSTGVGIQGLRIDTRGNTRINFTGVYTPTSATGGFIYLPTCNGVPSGTPAVIEQGGSPLIYDAAQNRIYVYNGSWKHVDLS